MNNVDSASSEVRPASLESALDTVLAETGVFGITGLCGNETFGLYTHLLIAPSKNRPLQKQTHSGREPILFQIPAILQ
jgi:hypothetical protein